MNPSNKILSDITAFNKYAKHLPHLARRETLAETINRCMTMHLDKFSSLSYDITKAFQRVHDLRVMPSMRSLQFAGEAILKNPARSYNCSYLPINDTKAYSEALFLLLSGVGVGFSVQARHVNQLPIITMPRESGTYVVQDSIVGWAEALNTLMEAYYFGKIKPEFDFSQIRAKGSYLVTTGAKAPGPEPLKHMLRTVEDKLKLAMGRKLQPIEVHDIICIVSDCVLSGGIRRAALISLFDRNDEDMLKSKHGEWWVKHPYRARANNSAVLPYNEVSKEEFMHIFDMCKKSGSGEPGFSWTNNPDWGYNPSLRAGTRVWTKEYGMVPIETLENKSFTVKNLHGQYSEAKCWMSSPKETLYKITLEGGFVYYSTNKHEWPIVMKEGIKKVRTDELSTGMSIPRLPYQHNISSGNLGTYEDGLLVGYFYGDGWITVRKDTNKTQYGVCIPKNRPVKMQYLPMFEKFFNGKGHQHKSGTIEFNTTSKSVKDFFEQFGVSSKKTNLPSKIWRECSDEFINGFIKGLFDADGTGGEKDGNRISISSSKETLIKELQDLLGFKGIYLNLTFLEKPSYKVKGKTYFKNVKRFSLRRNLEVASKGKSVKIKSVEKTTLEEPVWDISVKDETHCFQLAGAITGNCHEIALNPNQFCNLTTINQTNIKDKRDFMNRIHSATLIGTIQAAYTDFHYLRPIWKEQTEREALLGVSFTGIADGNGIVNNDWLTEGAKFALEINAKYAKKLGINPAARVTTTKPEGTSSCILGSSSGVHARHAPYYVRRIRMNKDDALAVYLRSAIPDLVEDDKFSSTGVVVSLPQESPKNSIVRNDETAFSLFQRTLDYNLSWVRNGYREGDNQHNVSATISVRPEEWDQLGEQMWEHRHSYSGISLLPYDNGTYVQAPFEECTQAQYEDMMKLVKEVDLTKVREEEDKTTRAEELACVGGVCLIE